MFLRFLAVKSQYSRILCWLVVAKSGYTQHIHAFLCLIHDAVGHAAPLPPRAAYANASQPFCRLTFPSRHSSLLRAILPHLCLY
jgi:hypothetical protein